MNKYFLFTNDMLVNISFFENIEKMFYRTSQFTKSFILFYDF